jgi:glutathione peroxidase-family protein
MEPGTSAQIKEFVEEKYDGTFPLFEKVCLTEFTVQLPL